MGFGGLQIFRPGRGKSFSQDKNHLEAIMPVDRNTAIIHPLQLRTKWLETWERKSQTTQE